MAKNLEALAKEIYDEAIADNEPVTKEEALEMARMELDSKQIKRYEQSSEKKKPRKKERKIDTEKYNILSKMQVLLNEMGAEDAQMKNEVEISFNFNGSSYTLKLTKHRPK